MSSDEASVGAGTDLGPYRLVREIGRGGQGVVYLAEDSRLQRKVALKILTGLGQASTEAVNRFHREAEVASRLEHPGICGVHDAGVIGGTPYIAMQYVAGETLGARIARARSEKGIEGDATPDRKHRRPNRSKAPLSPGRAEVWQTLELFEKTARALHAAHEAGVIHRDIKPNNIMVSLAGDPVLLDFGMARADDVMLDTLTKTGDVFGTPAYMSPEQITGRIKPDRRSDVYSLGVALYETLTLQRPFNGPTREALYQAIIGKDASDPRASNPSVPVDLKVVLEMALEKDRDRRYQTALALADDLRRVKDREPVLARPATPWLKLRRWVERRPGIAASLAAAFLILIAGTAISIHFAAKAGREAESAREARRLADLRAESEHGAKVEAQRHAAAEKAAHLETVQALERAQGLRLAATALTAIDANPGRSLLIAMEAARRASGASSSNVLFAAMLRLHEVRRLVGHENYVLHSVFSPDGTRVATCASDATVRLWDAETGRELRRIDGHRASLAWVEFSRDGRQLVSASEDGVVRTWDVEGRPLATTRAAQARYRKAHWSQSGAKILSFGSEGAASVWDLRTGGSTTIAPPGTKVFEARFDPAASMVACALGTPDVVVFDAVTGAEVRRLRAGGAGVRTIEWSQDGSKLISGADDGTVRLWDAALGTETASWSAPRRSGVYRVFLERDGNRAAALCRDGSLHVLEGPTLAPVSVVSGVGDIPRDAFHPQWTEIVTPEAGGAAILSLTTGERIATLRGHHYFVNTARYSPDGRRITTASSDMTVAIWTPRPAAAFPTWSGHLVSESSAPRELVATSADARRAVVVEGAKDQLELVDPSSGAVIAILETAAAGRMAAVYHAEKNELLLARKGSSEVSVLDGSTGTLVRRFSIPGIKLRGVEFAPDGDHIVIFGREPDAFVVENRADAKPRRFSVPNRFWLGPKAELMAVVRAEPSNEIELRATDDDRLVQRLKGHRGLVVQVCFSRDGKRLYSSAADRSIRMWNLDDPAPSTVITVPKIEEVYLSLSPSGKLLGARSEDAIRIFDAATGVEHATIPIASRRLWFAPDESAAFVCLASDAIRRIELDALSLAARVAPDVIAPRDLLDYDIGSPEERSTYAETWNARHPSCAREVARGQARLDAGDHAGALERFGAARDILPSSTAAHISLLKCFCAQVRPDGAAESRAAILDCALAALARSVDDPVGAEFLKELQNDPALAVVRADARFAPLLEKLKAALSR